MIRLPVIVEQSKAYWLLQITQTTNMAHITLVSIANNGSTMEKSCYPVT